MDYFSDPQETVSRFGDYIDDFHDVFRCNDVDFGFPEDFFTFARRVNHDSELRGDVLRVVKSVMEGEANISFRTILTIMAVGSGGPEVTASKQEMSVPVNLIIEALTIDDGRSGFSPAPSGGFASNLVEEGAAHNPVALSGYSAGVADAVERPDLEEPHFEGAVSGPAAGFSVEQGPSIDEGPSSVYDDSNALAETLTQTELNALQAEVSLDSIERGVDSTEPRLEKVPSLAPSGPMAHPSDDEGEPGFFTAIAAAANFELPHYDPLGPNERSRLLAESLAAPPRLWSDLRQFYSSRRQINVSVLSCAATLLFIGSLVWSVGRFTGRAVARPVNASVEGVAKPAAVSTVPLTASSASDPSVAPVGEAQSAAVAGTPVTAVTGAQGDRVDASSVAAAATTKESSQAPANGSRRAGVSRPIDRPVQPPKKPTHVSFKSPSPPTSSLDGGTSHEMTANASEDSASSDRSYSLSSEPLSGRLVNVSSGVMAANLVSSAKPSYPKFASLVRAQGNVVMQAVISRTGTVEHVHVIKGHRLLRGAAKNAVKTWRYRPYKVNGVPVDVATIVSVEFALNGQAER